MMLNEAEAERTRFDSISSFYVKLLTEKDK